MNNIEPEKEKIIADVLTERKRQDEKWGEQNHAAAVWGMIIAEEYGEMCKAINEFGFNPTPETEQDIYTEAIQTIASCMAMLECMERDRSATIRDEEIIIKTNRTLRGLFLPPLPPGEYPAGCNKHGAVYVQLPEGKTLGVKQGEFEFIKAPAWLLEIWKEADIE